MFLTKTCSFQRCSAVRAAQKDVQSCAVASDEAKDALVERLDYKEADPSRFKSLVETFPLPPRRLHGFKMKEVLHFLCSVNQAHKALEKNHITGHGYSFTHCVSSVSINCQSLSAVSLSNLLAKQSHGSPSLKMQFRVFLVDHLLRFFASKSFTAELETIAWKSDGLCVLLLAIYDSSPLQFCVANLYGCFCKNPY